MHGNETKQSTSTDANESRGGVDRGLIRHAVGITLGEAGFGDIYVISHEQADLVLTPKRRELIETLAAMDVRSVRDLADTVGRDPGNVSRDLKILVAEGIVRYETEGSAKKPVLDQDTIIQEPIVSTDLSE